MNSLHNLLQKIWYDSEPDLTTSVFKAALTPFRSIYGFFASRNRQNVQPEKLSAPVISVGNLTVGGTGKTTFVIELNNLLTEKGLSGVILTRGHGRKSKKNLFLNRNITQLPDCEKTGDEPLVLYRQCGGTPVLIGSNRLKNYKEYVAYSQKPDFVLLDDGFQHHAIQKDVNICLIDGKRQLGNGDCLPVGPLREPISSTPKPDIVILTRYDETIETKEIEKLFPNIPFFKTTFSIGSFTLLSGKEEETVPEKNTVLVSALGNNEQFCQSVQEANFEVSKHFSFPDHHLFSAQDISRIEESAQANGVQTILTTWKDAVKIQKWIKSEEESNIKWYACNLSVAYEGGDQERLKKIIQKAFL